jgi:hypothetical protein
LTVVVQDFGWQISMIKLYTWFVWDYVMAEVNIQRSACMLISLRKFCSQVSKLDQLVTVQQVAKNTHGHKNLDTTTLWWFRLRRSATSHSSKVGSFGLRTSRLLKMYYATVWRLILLSFHELVSTSNMYNYAIEIL